MRLPTGHLRKRGSFWWCQWKHHGVPYAKSLGTGDAVIAKNASKKLMATVRASVSDGTHFEKYGRKGASAIENGDTPLSQAWQLYRNSVSRPDASPQTIQQYEYQWGRFVKWLRTEHPEIQGIPQVTRQVAQEFAAWLSGRASINTYNKYVQLFRLVFRILGNDIGIEANPWQTIQKRKANGNGAAGRRAFTDEELRRIFETLRRRTEGRQIVWGDDGVIKERELGQHDRECAGEMLTICLLALHTGLRMGDCCLLKWEDMDLDKGVISVTPMKTSRTSGRKVSIPIHPELADRLSAIRPDSPSGHVCPTKAEQYIRNRTEVCKRFLMLFHQCGISTTAERKPGGAHATCTVGFHSFRHTWVSRSAEDGVDPITIREVVGWGSPAMERIYTHVSPEHVRSEMSKRKSKAFPSGDAKDDAKNDPPASDVGTMTTDRIMELARALAEELAKRRAGQ